ncbi:MAG: ATP-dependent DNA helicase RecG [Flavobacteriales bacterium]
MSDSLLSTPIEYLKGVGPKRAALLRSELNIDSFEDLLYYYPFRYIDRSEYHRIRDLDESMGYAQIKGTVTAIEESGPKHRKRLKAGFTDDSGQMELIWFKGLHWIKSMLKPGADYLVYGKPVRYGKMFNMAHPEVEPLTSETTSNAGKLQPVYHSTEKLGASWLNSKGIEKLQRHLLEKLDGKITDALPPELIARYRMLSRDEALRQIHFPQSAELMQKAQFRLKFEEFLFIKTNRSLKLRGYQFEHVGNYFNHFYKEVLSFELTDAQKRVIKEMRSDMNTGRQMNRLLQGDVGSGKTIVALMCMLIALDNHCQAAMMTPTEILAGQHFKTLQQLTEKLGIKTALLTGSLGTRERKDVLQGIAGGEIDILVGTHALIQDNVAFRKLGLAIIDEQHRFGVAQRASLWHKGEIAPHVLVMTATPIPRTLAMTLYGDLDVSVIDELPPGRQTVKTVHRNESSRLRVFGFLKEQIAKGRQVYIVYPLIAESQKLDYKNLMDGYDAISSEFPIPQYQLSIVHGQMDADAKEFEMQRFKRGETQIMIATNVIEVGVDVPNATVMVIESAERFGLSQLHQLRGRVGRGGEQSYCILLTGKELSRNAKQRMNIMTETTDGFKISEADLQLRGPGDLMGTQQSGIPELRIGDLAKDGRIIQLARDAASGILKNDPGLELPEHSDLRKNLLEATKERRKWIRIS